MINPPSGPGAGGVTTLDDDVFMRHRCATCGRFLPICCGDNTNGFWCHECCPHPYDEEDNDDEGEFDCGMDRHGGAMSISEWKAPHAK